jgi:pimeloyl-ACP methyl ester carboxylesterase
LRIVGAIAALYVLLLIALFFAQRWMVFPMPRDATAAPPAGFSAIRLDAEDGLHLTGAYRAGSAVLPTILFFHGNGDSLAGAEVATRGLATAGYGVLLVEYRGYGGNPGSPNEQGLYRDGRAALAWLEQHGIGSRRTILVGNSLGSGVATELATRKPVAGLVLVSGYTSMADVAAPLYPWLPVRMLLRDRFENRAKISQVRAPILLLHGTADRLIPARHSMALAAAGRRTTLGLVPGAGHDLVYMPKAQAMILHWLARLREPAGGVSRANDQAPGAALSAAASQSGTIASPSASVRRSSTIRPSSG